MITRSLLPVLSTLLLVASVSGAAQTTAFIYQGRLNDNGQPANGIYDLRFTLYDSPTNGAALAGPITNSLAPVSNGLFTVTLDFGAGMFDGNPISLQIAVQTN